MIEKIGGHLNSEFDEMIKYVWIINFGTDNFEVKLNMGKPIKNMKGISYTVVLPNLKTVFIPPTHKEETKMFGVMLQQPTKDFYHHTNAFIRPTWVECQVWHAYSTIFFKIKYDWYFIWLVRETI